MSNETDTAKFIKAFIEKARVEGKSPSPLLGDKRRFYEDVSRNVETLRRRPGFDVNIVNQVLDKLSDQLNGTQLQPELNDFMAHAQFYYLGKPPTEAKKLFSNIMTAQGATYQVAGMMAESFIKIFEQAYRAQHPGAVLS